MNPFGLIKSLLLALQGEDDPSHLAAGFALGAALGLVPKGNLIALLFFLLFFLFRVNKALALLCALLFTALGHLLDPLAHAIGRGLLTAEPLRPAWTWLYNQPVLPWTKFNNSVVLGSLALGLLLFAPLYLGFKGFVFYYRDHWRERVNALPLVKAVKGLYLVRLYTDWSERLGR